MNAAGMSFQTAGSVKRAGGFRIHHIASNKHKSKWTARFASMFDEVGLSFEDEANKVSIPALYHPGRHPEEYHEVVYEALTKRLRDAKAGGIVDKEILKLELQDELRQIGRRIHACPGILHNTIGGMATGWKGLRSVLKGL